MGRREAEEARQGAATLVQQAWSGGYKRACEVGGAIFVPMAVTPYGGWHKEDKDLAESWTRKTTHTGDGSLEGLWCLMFAVNLDICALMG